MVKQFNNYLKRYIVSMKTTNNSEVLIYKPAVSAMQSGEGKNKKWVLEFLEQGKKLSDPITGWTGGGDTASTQLRLFFASKNEALQYAKNNNLQYSIVEPKEKKYKIKSYVDNFKV